MRGAPLLLLALLAGTLPAPAGAQGTTIALDMLDEDQAFFFRMASGGARNPTLLVAAGSTVRIDVTNQGALDHNLRVGAPIDRETPCCQEPGGKATLEFQVPADTRGPISYWCTIHRDLGMTGQMRVAPAGGVPSIEILRPADQATVPPRFTVEVRVLNLTLGAAGHLHYVVNGTEGLPGWDTNATSLVIDANGTGYHHVRVELVTASHDPFDPPVVDEAFVFVSESAPPESATPAGTSSPTPADAAEDKSFLPLPGTLAIIGACAAAAWLRRRAHR